MIKKTYEILYCFIAGIAFVCALFEATYLVEIPYLNQSFRDVYLVYFPLNFRQAVTSEDIKEASELSKKKFDQRLLFFDKVLGIKVHRTTRDYLKLVDHINELLKQSEGNVINLNLSLGKLQEASIQLVDHNPFKLANKSGDLERIKNLMRNYTGQKSSKEAFSLFWSQKQFENTTLEMRLIWFNVKIRPLMNRNYFRWIGEDGLPENHYNTFDRWFVFFFLFDFCMRWFSSIYKKEYRKWYLFPVRNWTEVFNLYPPAHSGFFRILRIIPLFLRMRENNFLPQSGLAPAIIHDNAGVIAEEISGMVVLNLLTKTKAIIQNKGLSHLANSAGTTLNDNLEQLLKDQAGLISQKVVPAIEPNIIALVKHSLNEAMGSYLNSPIGPGVRIILNNTFGQIQSGLEAAISGPEGTEQLTKIMQIFIKTLLSELGKEENMNLVEEHVILILDDITRQLKEQLA